MTRRDTSPPRTDSISVHRQVLKTFSLTFGLLFIVVACKGEGCDTALRDGVRVTVKGGGLGDEGLGGAGGTTPSIEACLADVRIEPPTSDFDCYSDGDDCVCAGLQETAGDFTLTAVLDGVEATEEVTIAEGDCHVVTEDVCFFGPC